MTTGHIFRTTGNNMTTGHILRTTGNIRMATGYKCRTT
jgi:hypothetical protein